MAIQKPVAPRSITRDTAHKRRAASTKNGVIDAWQAIIDLGKGIPSEDLRTWPRDGARNLEHYLYGAPKRR